MWQRPELGRAKGEIVGLNLGHEASKTGVGPEPQRPLLATPKGRPKLTTSPGKGYPARGCWGLLQAPNLASASHRLRAPWLPLELRRECLCWNKDGCGGRGKGREGIRIDLGAWGFTALTHENPRV